RLRHRQSALAQNLDGLLVSPIVHDILQHIGMTAGGYGLEEISGHIRAAPAVSLGSVSGRCRDNRWLIEDNDARAWARLQDRRAQDTVTTSHVDDRRIAGEFVRGDDRDGVLLSHVALMSVEDRRSFLRGVEIAE